MVVAADLDGDGDLDLAVVNNTANSISVLLNNGDGTFAARTDYATGSYPWSLAAGDLDGDGDQDLVAASALPAGASVLLGNGDGTFANRVNYPTVSFPSTIAIADFDADSDPDLAITCNAVAVVSVLPGRGDGTFDAHVDYATGAGPEGIVAADLDADGRPDLATATEYDGAASVLLNTGGVPPADIGPAPAGRLALTAGPNPAREATTLRLHLPRAGEVSLRVCDVGGRVVAVPLERAWRPAGARQVPLMTADWHPGLYLCRLTLDGTTARARLVVVR
jgi:hypothetical protein